MDRQLIPIVHMISQTTSKPIDLTQSQEPSPELVKEIKEAIERQLRLTLARHFDNATKREVWMATCLAVRERIIDRFIETQATHNGQETRRVYYLSLEYLMGRLLNVNLRNTGLHQSVALALRELGFDLDA